MHQKRVNAGFVIFSFSSLQELGIHTELTNKIPRDSIKKISYMVKNICSKDIIVCT